MYIVLINFSVSFYLEIKNTLNCHNSTNKLKNKDKIKAKYQFKKFF